MKDEAEEIEWTKNKVWARTLKKEEKRRRRKKKRRRRSTTTTRRKKRRRRKRRSGKTSMSSKLQAEQHTPSNKQ